MKIKILRKNFNVDFLIYDKEHSETLRDKLLYDFKNEIIDVRDLPIILNFKFILSFGNFFIKNFDFNRIKNQLKISYLGAFIIYYNPKCLITMTDNDGNFHKLSRKFPQKKFIAIQNGLRYPQNYENSFFFCFGNQTIKTFNNSGYSTKNFFPVGSIYADYKWKYNCKLKYDILFIPTYFVNQNSYEMYSDFNFMKLKTILRFLKRIQEEENFKIAIITRHDNLNINWYNDIEGMNEMDFYKMHTNDSVEVIMNNQKEKIIYNKMSESKLIISDFSTALIEAYGKEKKCFYVKIPNDNKLNILVSEELILEKYDYKIFKKRIIDIYNMPDEIYLRKNKKSMRYNMDYTKNGTINSIREKLNFLINDNN